MQNAIVNVNGQIVAPEDAKIPVFDRSYLYGDSLYEVVRSYGGVIYGLDEHLKRLEKSAALCRITLGQSINHYRAEILRSFEEFKKRTKHRGDVYIRLIVSRGIGRIGFGLQCLLTPTQYVLILQPLEEPTDAQLSKGLSIGVGQRLRNDRRALDPAMKSGNYLNSLLAYLEAQAEDRDDAILCDGNGQVTEGTTFNLFYARRGIIATPPLEIGILDGITRRDALEAASQLGIEAREVRFPPERLFEADEVFLTSSIKGVFPITRLDGKPIGKGVPGPLTLKLRAAVQKKAEACAR